MKKNNLPRHVVICSLWLGTVTLQKLIGLVYGGVQCKLTTSTEQMEQRFVLRQLKAVIKKKVNENKKVLVISCSSSIKRFQSHLLQLKQAHFLPKSDYVYWFGILRLRGQN